jgi:hypothetical protein
MGQREQERDREKEGKGGLIQCRGVVEFKSFHLCCTSLDGSGGTGQLRRGAAPAMPRLPAAHFRKDLLWAVVKTVKGILRAGRGGVGWGGAVRDIASGGSQRQAAAPACCLRKVLHATSCL